MRGKWLLIWPFSHGGLSFRLGKLAQKQNAKWNDNPEHWWVAVSPRLFFMGVIRERHSQVSALSPSPLHTQRVLNCLAHGDGCFTGHTFPWWQGWQGPVSLQEVEWWEEWKRAMFSSRTITLWKLWHWFANISFLWLPEAFINIRYHGVYDSELMK